MSPRGWGFLQCICGEIRAPGSIHWFGGLLFPEPSHHLILLEEAMDKKELAYAKQAVTAVTDWDIFQAIIRNYKILLRLSTKSATAVVGGKG